MTFSFPPGWLTTQQKQVGLRMTFLVSFHLPKLSYNPELIL